MFVLFVFYFVTWMISPSEEAKMWLNQNLHYFNKFISVFHFFLEILLMYFVFLIVNCSTNRQKNTWWEVYYCSRVRNMHYNFNNMLRLYTLNSAPILQPSIPLSHMNCSVSRFAYMLSDSSSNYTERKETFMNEWATFCHL